RGDEETGEPGRNVRDEEVREDTVGLGDGLRDGLAGEAVEAPEETADEHEGGPHREAETCSERDAADGSAVRARDEVALHDSLVRRVLLQVEEEAVDDEHDDGRLVEAKSGAAEAHLVVRPCVGEDGARTL